jgi:predicted amidohydrolase
VRITLAQIDCALGDISENVRRIRETMGRARDDGADFVVFPELVLTGYSIGQVDDDVSRALSDPELAGLVADSGDVGAFVGFAEDGPVHVYDSVACLEGGEVRHVHRKVHLPTYDIWEERKHFTPGGTMRAFDTRAGRMAILLCGDAWQPVLAVLAVQDGARVLVVPAASTVQTHEDISREWHEITRFYARMLQCYVVFVNRVGAEPGLRFWGGSHIRDPWGEMVVEAPRDEPAVVTAEVDRAAVRRRRREYPLIKEARLALLSRELDRLASEGGDL